MKGQPSPSCFALSQHKIRECFWSCSVNISLDFQNNTQIFSTVLVHIPKEISSPVFLSAAGTIRAFVRHRAEAGCPHDDWSPSNFWYLRSVCPLRGGGSANKSMVKLGEITFVCNPYLSCGLATPLGCCRCWSAAAPGQGWKAQPGAFTLHGRKALSPHLMSHQGILKFSEMTHTLARDSLASGTELILKSRIACCSSWHPKSPLVPAIHMVIQLYGRQHRWHLHGDKRHLLASGGLFHFCSSALTFFKEMVCLGNVVGEQPSPREKNVVGEKFSQASLPVLLGHHYFFRCFLSSMSHLTFEYI